MGGRKGLDARSAISCTAETRAVGAGGTANWQGFTLAMATAPGATPHLQDSATQHAGSTLVSESSATESEPFAKGDALIAVDGCEWEWHWALDPRAASPGIEAIAGDVNAPPTCQSSRVAKTVPR